jgi:hypothetical protein
VSRHVRAQRTACTIGEVAPHSEDVLPSASSQRQVGGDVRAQRTTVPTKGRDRIARTRFERTRNEMCGPAARLLAVAPWERDTGAGNASRASFLAASPHHARSGRGTERARGEGIRRTGKKPGGEAGGLVESASIIRGKIFSSSPATAGLLTPYPPLPEPPSCRLAYVPTKPSVGERRARSKP